MKINKILYLMRDKLEALPPSMSQIVTLCNNGYEVCVITSKVSDYIKNFFKNYNVIFWESDKSEVLAKNKFDKIFRILNFRKKVKYALKTYKYDLIWIGSADTALYCKDILKTRSPYVLNIYELYDTHPKMLKSIKELSQKAESIVVPEYNRAHILKVWLELKKTPVIIPNKPNFSAVEIDIKTKEIVDGLKALNKKIVLYQGWIGKDRDVSKIADALNTLENKDEYVLILMGKVMSSDTINYIKNKFNNTIHIPFLSPPQHLFVTESAYIGIATYDDSTLNNIFCAPNKIYEYAEKNVPILARNIPGLTNTIGKFNAGVCVDTENILEIAHAIKEIDINHDKYTLALRKFINEYNVNDSILQILRECEDAHK